MKSSVKLLTSLILIVFIVCIIHNLKHTSLRCDFNSINAVAFLRDIDNGYENKGFPVILRSDNSVRDCVTRDTVYAYKGHFEKEDLSLKNVDGSYTESSHNRTQSFVNVFINKAWGKIREDSNVVSSGPGSTLYFTQEAIGVLNSVISAIKQRTGKTQLSMLDLPCGDMTWMSRFLKTRDDIHYTGMDIVPDIISGHQQKFKQQTNWTFLSADILHENTTIGKYDLIFSRMMMQHLYHYDAMEVLLKISKSGSLTPPVCIHRDGPPQDRITKKVFLGLWTLPLYMVINCETMSFTSKRETNRTYYGCGVSK